MLSLFYRILGPTLLVAPVLNAFFGAGVTAIIHRIGRHFTTPGRAKLAAALVALHPGLIAYSPLVMTEILATLLLLGAGLLLLAQRGSWRGYLGAGALLGISTLVRPDSLLALPLLLLMGERPYLRSFFKSAGAVGMAFVIILPWTYRNCQKLDGCALVSTNGGWAEPS